MHEGGSFPMNGRFNWLKVWISLNIFLLPFSQVVSSDQIQNVPVVPNDSIITAKVLEYNVLNSTLEEIEPEQILYSLRVLVLSSKSIKGKANFTQSKVNQVIKVYSKEVLLPILFGKVIEANVSFSGDEKGRKYWVRSLKVIEEMPEKDYMTIKKLEDFCKIPGVCGKALNCEGKKVKMKGYLDYINIFDRQAYPNLPYQKFRIFDGPNILNTDNPWASYAESLEIYPIKGNLELMFKKLHAKAGLPLKLVYITGIIEGLDAPTNTGCRRMIQLKVDADDVLFEEALN